MLGVTAAGFLLTASLPTLATAADNLKDVVVANTTANPVPTQAVGTASVEGTVNVGNLPATQQVVGTVDVGNLPATQQVAGTIGIDPEANQVRSAPILAYTTTPRGETDSWSSWSVGYGYRYTAFAAIEIPDGQELQARWFSALVTTPDAACTTQYGRVVQWGNDGGAGSYTAADKVGSTTWVVSGEVLVPNAAHVAAVVNCPDGPPPVGSVSVMATVSGDLFPAT